MEKYQNVMFDAESVRGLLTCANCGKMSVPVPCEICGGDEFTKTQTRRIVRRLKMHEDYGKPVWSEAWIDPVGCLKVPYRGGIDETVQRHWPAYEDGDIGWVREPLHHHFRNAVYSCDGRPVIHPGTGRPIYWTWKVGSLPGMFMPKLARRLWVLFETPTAERLQDITEEDSIAEGVFGPPWSGAGWRNYPYEACPLPTAKESYKSRIMAIHGPTIWEENWWVWVYKFHRISPPDE